MYPPLPKSYKGVYPFTLAGTSYIYPDHIIPNVKMLGPYLDEIELLLLESTAKDSLPSKDEIKTLSMLAEEFDLSYNIHLPTDIFLADRDPSTRRSAIEIVKQVIDLTIPLSPSTYTLHLLYNGESVKRWKELVRKSMKELLRTRIKSKTISIETLTYPFEWVERIISDLDLSICIDFGHLVACGFDIEETFKKYSDRTSIIHLHGVENTGDHISLDRFPKDEIGSVVKILKRFTGIVSLEVFSYDHLEVSLRFLERCWQRSSNRR